jgi:hypothetical protein
MALLEKVEADLKTAMKNKEKEKTEALRSIKTAIMLAKTEKGADKNISEEKETKIIQKLVKQRKESAEIYQQQGRKELAEMELNEAKFIENYLPEQISDKELTEIIGKIIEETGAESMKDMGKVMGVAQRQLAGKADGKVIADKVKSLLS